MNQLSESQAERKIQDLMTSGRRRAGVWGLGYIGHSTFAALVEANVSVVGFDIDPVRVSGGASILTGEHHMSEATDDDRLILRGDVIVHFVAVPTERRDQPSDEAITDVFRRILNAVADGRQPRGVLVVVESTLAPGTTDGLLLPMITEAGLVPDEDVLVALAPRRDWLTFGRDGLRTLDRVFGGIGPRSSALARVFLSLMTDTLHEARTHVEAELVKCVENAYRHVEVTLANQLTLAFPHVDMVDVLRLAGTKWNMSEYHPSFGTGGYCVPLAGRYLLQGTGHPEELTLVSQALTTDDGIRKRVIESVADAGPVLILGLAYKGNVKVATLSPTIAMARRLRELAVEHAVYDPLYTPEEILAVCGSNAPTDLVEAISSAATIVVVADHDAFLAADFVAMLTVERSHALTVLDNYGMLAGVVWPEHVRYRRAGEPGWLLSVGGAAVLIEAAR